jgi:catalase-peroxidase
MIYAYDNWELEESPAGAKQWRPVADEINLAPHAHLENEFVEIRMLTTDLALRFGDEKYDEICQKFLVDFEYFSEVFAKAWYKLTHRDLGPKVRYLGAEVPERELLWQDPIPQTNAAKYMLDSDREALKQLIIETGLTPAQLIKTAWASASTYRNTDKRGGANGARITLEPQISWEINEPEELKDVLAKLKQVKIKHKMPITMADLIVFAGGVGVELSIEDNGVDTYTVPFIGGRGDATQELTDVESFEHLRPVADGFRNYAPGHEDIAERLLLEKAALLGLTPPELTVLVGGLRVLGVNHGGSTHGVLTETPGVLNNAFFRNLLDTEIAWAPKADLKGVYGSHAYADGERKWTATRADLVFASNSVLRALAEVYASDDAGRKFILDFIAAWTKVMNADRFDI